MTDLPLALTNRGLPSNQSLLTHGPVLHRQRGLCACGELHVAALDLAVLLALARGQTYQQAANTVHRRHQTVKNRLYWLYAAIGAKSNVHAVAIVLQRGLIRLEDI